MRTPLITLATAGLLSVVFAASAFASTSVADIGGALSAGAPLGGGTFLQVPGTSAVGGVTNLPSTSTIADGYVSLAIGAVLMTFGVALLALRSAIGKR